MGLGDIPWTLEAEGSAAQQRHTQHANMLQKTLCSLLLVAALALASDVQPIKSSLPDIVQLASNDPALSTFVTALKAAKLTDFIGGGGPFTVFAPTNKAFSLLPAATLAHLLDP